MAIFGLCAIIEKDFRNFRPIHLHNCNLVIHGLDFMGHMCRNLRSTYGSEHLAYHLKIKDALDVLARCNICPYFVFGHVIDYRGKELESKINNIVYKLDQFITDESDMHFIPIGARMTIVQTLHQSRIKYASVPYRPVDAVTSLASHLKCPFLTSTSDFYLQVPRDQGHGSVDVNLPPHLPLRFFELKAISSNNQEAYVLSAHEYIRSSILHSVSPSFWPLLGLLLGTNSMPKSRLPSTVKDDIVAKSEEVHPREHRFNVLRTWLSGFAAESREPIQMLIQCHPEKDQALFVQQLTECFPSYFVDVADMGQKISGKLQLSGVSRDYKSTRETNDLLTYVQKLDSHSSSNKQNVADITSGWPFRLTRAFLDARVHPSNLAALYSPCTFFTVNREDPKSELSINHSSLPLRWMQYCVLTGLEEHLGNRSKLMGLCPHATEYLRRGSKLVAHAVHVEPHPIQPQRDRTDEVIRSFLHNPLVHRPCEHGWVFSLAVVLAFWYAHTSVPQSKLAARLDESPIMLAVAACAVSCSLENGHFDWMLWEHYEKLSESMESGPPCLSIAHQFGELQSIYTTFTSLVNLLDSLVEFDNQSELFHFPALFSVFPSARLVHNLTQTLEAQAPSVRRRVITRYWLPRLYRRKGDMSLCSQDLCELDTNLNQLLDVATALNLQSIKVKTDVYELKVDTPQALKPKDRHPRANLGPPPSARHSLPPKPVYAPKSFPPPPPRSTIDRGFGPPRRKPISTYARRLQSRLSENN